MKIKLNGVKSVYIKSDFIKLDSLLKFASVVSTGGEAKLRIQNGEVFLGKKVCIERGRKIRPGDVVRCGEDVILVKEQDCSGLQSETFNDMRSGNI